MEEEKGGVVDWLADQFRGINAGVTLERGKLTSAYVGAGATPSTMRDIGIGVLVGLIVTKLVKAL